jgi:hypothetical protein
MGASEKSCGKAIQNRLAKEKATIWRPNSVGSAANLLSREQAEAV